VRVLLQGENIFKKERIILIVVFLYVTHCAKYQDDELILPWLNIQYAQIQ
jgi:hypothetical protein